VTRRNVYLVLAAAAAIFGLTLGIRTALALFISAINTQTGLGLVAISFAFAVSQLTWGLAQPFAGAIADRYGAGRVLGAGILMIAAGTALTAVAGYADIALALGAAFVHLPIREQPVRPVAVPA